MRRSRSGPDWFDDVHDTPPRDLSQVVYQHRFERDGPRRSLHSCLTETVRDWMPRPFQTPLRYRGRLRKFPKTFDDLDMLFAFQGRSIVRPSW